MSFLFFAGSLRSGSLNKKLVREALRIAAQAGTEGSFIDLKDYPMPVYDGDIEAATGLPDTARKLGGIIRDADALVIATPEYNSSMPGMLKNVIDWISRDKPMPFADKHLLLLAASPGAMGGLRVLWHSRQIYTELGMHVFPGMYGLTKAAEAFDENGRLKDAGATKKVQNLLAHFAAHVQRG